MNPCLTMGIDGVDELIVCVCIEHVKTGNDLPIHNDVIFCVESATIDGVGALELRFVHERGDIS